jgi:ribosomal protein L20
VCHNQKTAEENTDAAKGRRIFAKAHGLIKSKGRSFNRAKKPKPKPGYWEPYDFDETTGKFRRSIWIEPTTE